MIHMDYCDCENQIFAIEYRISIAETFSQEFVQEERLRSARGSLAALPSSRSEKDTETTGK